MGYHTREIDKGEYGEVSKIREEWEEFLDAWGQGAKLLQLCELADMLGAMAAYVEKHFPGMTLADVQVMADMTRSAFREGSRVPNVKLIGEADRTLDPEDREINRNAR